MWLAEALVNAGDGTERTRRASGLVYIVGTYPRLTTTFIDREIEHVRKLGVGVRVISLRRPSGPLSPEQTALDVDVRTILPVPLGELLRSHLWYALRRPLSFWGTLAYLVTRPHPRLGARLRTVMHFGEGVHVAYVLRDQRDYDRLHAHFVDRAATVALVAGRLLGVPYSATAHANDIYVEPVLLREKIAGARFVATCSEHNAATLSSLAGPSLSDRIVCIHHGLDLERYEPGAPDGRVEPALILAVGQLKEKKGFSHLIGACRALRDRGYDFACDIVGEGPLRADLETLIREAGLEGTVTLSGARPHGEVVARYRAATIFALPCVTGEDGDRDGIPNVILEAMAMELPVVSTRHSGIPEAVEDGWSGVLVASGDAHGLAAELAGLLADPGRRTRLGRRARQTVAEKFDVAANVKALVARMGEDGL